jgi:hypothetical protein
MRNISRRGSGLLLGLAIVLGAPALAGAQLIPDLPIRRQRPDCSQENPQYKIIRQEYWGYYPTCWKRFPAGSGCPSPEAPNWEKSKLKPPLAPLGAIKPTNPDQGDNTEPPGDGMQNPPPDQARPPANPKPADVALPPPLSPDAPSPFDTDPKPPTTDPKNPTNKPALPRAPGDAPAPGDPPKTSGISTPTPFDDGPTTTAAPVRRRSLIAGLFGRGR